MEAIESQVLYLIKDPKFEHEKPYTIFYDNGGAFPKTNTETESKDISISNYRPLLRDTSFEDVGFTLRKIDCNLSLEEFHNEERVKSTYYPAIMDMLWKMFPTGSSIKVLGHALRKRHAEFPIATGETYEFNQPTTVVHTDYTLQTASTIAQNRLESDPDQYRRLITVNVWKPIQGPGNDWPLALCDAKSVVRGADGAIEADQVYHDGFTANERLYYDANHRWYYFKDVEENEVIVFRQTDSAIHEGGGVPHTSFYNSKVEPDALPRESIELRAFVFFDHESKALPN